MPLRGTPIWLAGTNWWDAKEVQSELLDFLTENAFPGFVPGELVIGRKPLTRDYYENRISELCKVAKKNCEVSKLKFKAENFTIVTGPN